MKNKITVAYTCSFLAAYVFLPLSLLALNVPDFGQKNDVGCGCRRGESRSSDHKNENKKNKKRNYSIESLVFTGSDLIADTTTTAVFVPAFDEGFSFPTVRLPAVGTPEAIVAFKIPDNYGEKFTRVINLSFMTSTALNSVNGSVSVVVNAVIARPRQPLNENTPTFLGGALVNYVTTAHLISEGPSGVNYEARVLIGTPFKPGDFVVLSIVRNNTVFATGVVNFDDSVFLSGVNLDYNFSKKKK